MRQIGEVRDLVFPSTAIAILRMTASHIVALGGALFGLAACGGGTDNDPTGQAWTLTELEGAPPLDGTTIDLTITDDGVSGSSGCNTYTGSAELDTETSSLVVGAELASTMMACEQPIMDQEQRYLAALASVVSYEMAADELILKDVQGIALATFG